MTTSRSPGEAAPAATPDPRALEERKQQQSREADEALRRLFGLDEGER